MQLITRGVARSMLVVPRAAANAVARGIRLNVGPGAGLGGGPGGR